MTAYRSALFTALILVASTALADWQLVGSSDRQNLYMDKSSRLKTGDIIKMWSLTDFINSNNIKSMKAQIEFDCKNRLSRPLFVESFYGQMGSGRLHSQVQKNDDWYAPSPDSSAGLQLEFACD